MITARAILFPLLLVATPAVASGLCTCMGEVYDSNGAKIDDCYLDTTCQSRTASFRTNASDCDNRDVFCHRWHSGWFGISFDIGYLGGYCGGGAHHGNGGVRVSCVYSEQTADTGSDH